MSSQRGNPTKTRAQKHRNLSAFKNNLHDTSNKTKMINSLSISSCCKRCTEVIEWKIKYKKYKPLSQARKCIHCSQKTVKRAYCIMCLECARSKNVCMKCGQREEILTQPTLTEAEEMTQMARLEQELKFLSERQRRTFHRLQASGKLEADALAACKGNPGDEDGDEDTDGDELSSDEDGEENCSGLGVEHLNLHDIPLCASNSCDTESQDIVHSEYDEKLNNISGSNPDSGENVQSTSKT